MISRFSLRARLTAAAAAITVVALVAADFVVFAEFRSYLNRQVDATLETSHRAVEVTADEASGGAEPADHSGVGDVPSQSTFCGVGFETAPGMFIEVRAPNGQIVTGSQGREYCPSFQPGEKTAVPALPKTITGFHASAEKRAEQVVYFTVPSATKGGPNFRVRASKLSIGGDVLIVADPIGNISDTLGRLVLIEILVTAGAVLAAVLMGLVLVRIGLRPLRDVRRTADAITGGDLEHRVPNANERTEVGHVATALNVMLDRIADAFSELQESEERLRRFVADASHELRTPIAAVSAYSELFRRGASNDAADLSRVLSGIEKESARMGQLVEDLLTLAKLDEGAPAPTDSVELVGLAHEAAETARTVGPQWPLFLEATDAVEVVGDRSALRRVIDNLLSNVRAHTPEGTRATISVKRVGPDAVIEVADEGPGITAEQAEVVFERFFRADRSRSRSTGGSGLGLAIVASVVRAHGGRVEARPRPGGGAVFRVVLPALVPISGVGSGQEDGS